MKRRRNYSQTATWASHSHVETADFVCCANNAVVGPRVLLLGPALSGGGAENRFRMVAEYLFGGKATIATLTSRGGELFNGSQDILHLGWRGARSYPAMILRLRRYLNQKNFDAVVAFGFYPNIIAFAAVLGLRMAPALVLTEIIALRQEGIAIRGNLRRFLVYMMRRLTLRQADLFAANSEEALNDAVELFGVNPKRVRRIPNIIEPDRLRQLSQKPNEPDNSNEVFSICTTSRLTSQKRVDVLMYAAASLSTFTPWQLDIVGDGEERTKLEELARRLGIAERVKFHGWLKNPYPIISRANIFVLCSAYEGFSNSVIEAMALRIPVVLSLHSVDAREMCALGAALGFEVGDHTQLKSSIEFLMQSSELRSALVDTGSHYIQRYTVQSAIPEYEMLVHDAVTNHSEFAETKHI